MKQSLIKRIFGGEPQPATRLLAVTPPRTGERTLLGVENLLGSIAVPEPFSLEIAGDAAGVTLLARCREGSFVKQQLGVHYPQARVGDVSSEDDPLRLAEGEQAWSMNLRLQGPEYLPLRTFRDDDLLDQGSDPLISVIGSLSDLEEGERLVARMKLLSLGPDWSRQHLEKADRRPQPNPSSSPHNADVQIHRNDGVTMAILGLIALPSLMGYVWIQRGETWKAVLLGLGMASLASLVGWAWWRIKKARSGGKHQDPLLIKEKVSRIAYEAELEVTAVLSQHGTESRARELLRNVASAYRGYDNPAGASFKAGKVRPAVPATEPWPPRRGMFQSRNVLGGREAAALWHPLGAGDDLPMVARSGARVLFPSAKGVAGGAHVGDTVASRPRKIHFQDDLLRRHHLYVARTRMGKSTLMHHVVTHKLREKAAGRDGDAIVVIDPHRDLVDALLRHVPAEIADKVRLIDLGDEDRVPGINLLDTKVFADRDRTADSVVRIAKGVWEQWDPGCSPSWSTPSRASTSTTPTPTPGRTSSSPSWTGNGCWRSRSSASRCSGGWATPTCWGGGRGTSQAGPASSGPRSPRRCRPAWPTTHRPRRPGPSWGSAAPPLTCGRSSPAAACCWCPPLRPRRDRRSRPWWARRCSTWWTR